MIPVHPAAPVAAVLVAAVLVAAVLVAAVLVAVVLVEVLVDPVVVKITMRKVIEILQRHKLFVLRRLLRVFFCQSTFPSQF